MMNHDKLRKRLNLHWFVLSPLFGLFLNFAPAQPATLQPLQRLGLGAGPYEVAWSSDSTRILTGGEGVAHLWSASSGQLLRAYGGFNAKVSGVAFLPGDRNVLISSEDGFLRIWDMPTGRLLSGFAGHTAAINCLAFSENGEVFATGSASGEVAVWSATTFQELLRQDYSSIDQVLSLDITATGDQLLAGCSSNAFDGSVLLISAATGEVNQQISFGGNVDAVEFSPDEEEFIVGGSFLGNFRRFDVATGGFLASYTCSGTNYSPLSYTQNGLEVFIGGQSTVGKFSLESENCSSFLQGFSGPITALEISPEGDFLVATSRGGTARVFSLPNGILTTTLMGFTDSQEGLVVTQNDEVITGGTNGVLRKWDPLTGVLLDEKPLTGGRIDGMTKISAETFAVGNAAGTIRLIEEETLATTTSWKAHASIVRSLASDGSALLSASEDNTTALWEEPFGVPGNLQSPAEGFLWSAALDMNSAWVGTNTGKIVRYNRSALNNPPLKVVVNPANSKPIFAMALDPQTSTLATGGGDSRIRLWNADTLENLAEFSSSNGVVHSIALSPNSRWLAAGNAGGQVQVWDRTNLEDTARILQEHTLTVEEVQFNQNNDQLYSTSLDGKTMVYELLPPRAVIVAGGGPYEGNSIARQTHELSAYAYRTLIARGYLPENVLFLSAFPEGTTFPTTPEAVAWDFDGDGTPEIDGAATRATFSNALEGPFAREAGRLTILMIDHGYRTGDVMAFRINPEEALTTLEMNGWLNDLQNAAPVDVTLVVDCCYSGQFVTDCRKTSAIPEKRGRIVISSTSETAEAVFLPAPDLTSFLHTFLGSAYMGNSTGEAFRSGARFFNTFPVAGQAPQLHDGAVLALDETTSTTLANRQFFGASWAYGVQPSTNLNAFFPAFSFVNVLGTEQPGGTITLQARLLPNQTAQRVSVAILQPAPSVLSGEPIAGLPLAELELKSEEPGQGQLWEATFLPEDADYPFGSEGAYRATFSAFFTSDRLSDPERLSFTISSGPDPDATPIRAVLAFGNSTEAPTRLGLNVAASFAYSVYLDRFQDPDGNRRGDWIDFFSSDPISFSPKTTRRVEQRALAAQKAYKQGGLEFTAQDVLAAITTRGNQAGRLVVHLAGADASGGVLQFSSTESLSATELDGVLDALTTPEIIVILDAPGSGSFIAPLAATGNQQRIILTSGRDTDCSVFLSDPGISYTHRLLAPLWGGENLFAAHQSASQFFTNFVGSFAGTRINAQLEDNGDGVSTIADGTLARTLYLGRRYAFAGDEASGLPFIVETEIISANQLGEPATLRLRLLEGIEPDLDEEITDPLSQAKVFAQFTPPGILCGTNSINLPRFRLRRESMEAWTWSTSISSAFLQELGTGEHPVIFFAEYPDGSTTKLSEVVTRQLVVPSPPMDGWQIW